MLALRQALAIGATLSLLAPGVAGATQIRFRTVEQLGHQSTMVARGTVTNVRSFWNDKHTKIFTETTVAVDETYKGVGAPSVRILQLGGAVDGVQVTVAGALHWTAGEEVLLFLEPYVDGAQQVSGFSQGKFHIERDPGTGRAFVRRPSLGGAEFVSPKNGQPVSVPDKMEKVPLNEFVNGALGRK